MPRDINSGNYRRILREQELSHVVKDDLQKIFWSRSDNVKHSTGNCLHPAVAKDGASPSSELDSTTKL